MATWRFIFFLILFSEILTALAAKDENRKFLARGFGVASCRNTKQGRWYLTDEKGTVCSWKEVDPMTGCCQNGEKNSCQTCSSDDQCCEVYEFCVSCCLAPENKASEKFSNAYRANGHPETGRWLDEFEYCQGKCRTHKRSTVHENAYIGKRHYCYSERGWPLVDEPKAPPLPENIAIVVSEPGEDCTSACSHHPSKKTCSHSNFQSLNSCNKIRDFFQCEAACKYSEVRKEPSYVTTKAPKSQRPATCYVGKINNDNNGSFNEGDCDWKDSHVRRLCPCEESVVVVNPDNVVNED